MRIEEPAISEAPLLTILPRVGWRSLNLREVWEFRDLLFALGMRDVKLVYKQTFLGITWVVLQPLIGAAIFAFVFGVLAQMPVDGVPYFVFAFAGMIGWTLFSSTLNSTSMIMIGNSHLITKIYFPRLILPLSCTLQPIVNAGVGLVIMAMLLCVYRIWPGFCLLAFPIAVASMLSLALGAGLWCSSAMIRYRDFRFIIPVVVQFLLYASPVGYSLAAIQKRVPVEYRTIYMLNPMASLMELFRYSLMGQGDIELGWLVYSFTVSVVMLVTGAFAFRKSERSFSDLI